MKEPVFGQILISKAGHDKGNLYICLDFDGKYVILADGKLKTLAKPKKKNLCHVQAAGPVDGELVEAKAEGRLRDEMIQRSLKVFANRDH